jgi:hypothetical protein
MVQSDSKQGHRITIECHFGYRPADPHKGFSTEELQEIAANRK